MEEEGRECAQWVAPPNQSWMLTLSNDVASFVSFFEFELWIAM